MTNFGASNSPAMGAGWGIIIVSDFIHERINSMEFFMKTTTTVTSLEGTDEFGDPLILSEEISLVILPLDKLLARLIARLETPNLFKAVAKIGANEPFFVREYVRGGDGTLTFEEYSISPVVSSK